MYAKRSENSEIVYVVIYIYMYSVHMVCTAAKSPLTYIHTYIYIHSYIPHTQLSNLS